MKHVEFTTMPPKFEVCAMGDMSLVRFYCDAHEVEREDGSTTYSCVCYEMATHPCESLEDRIERKYDAWLEAAIRQDGGLDAAKQEKIIRSKTELAEYIATHPLMSTAHGGVMGTYSVTEEKQALMTSQYISYQAEKAVNPDAKLTWNESGKSCEVWTEEEFLRLVVEIKNYVYPLVSYQQKVEEMIQSAVTLDELDAIVIDYESVS